MLERRYVYFLELCECILLPLILPPFLEFVLKFDMELLAYQLASSRGFCVGV